MSNNSFTKAELAMIFGPTTKRKAKATGKIIASLDHKPRPVGTIVEPFVIGSNDPKYKPPKINRSLRRNSIKVLTILKPWLIMKSTIKRKDDKMATKQKSQTNYMQTTAVCLLASGAVLGLADMLGGGLAACFVASLLVACLFVMAIDYRK